MDVFQEAERLQQIPMFNKLDAAKLKLLAFTSDAITWRDGEVLCRINEPSDTVFVILEGDVDILGQVDGKEVVLFTKGKDEMVGEMAVLSNSPRSATLRAKGTVKTLNISNDAFLRLITENPTVALSVMKQLSDKLALSTRALERVKGEAAA
ncbi:MAG: transcriptional regulator [marine bacterium B5-7]|nr:MAG: transcriptional regulator [marine bacterium B5-7]